MADKTQNIFVNYKFNTADIAKHNQQLDQSNKISNDLQKSAEKVGQSVSSNFNKGTKSIALMEHQLKQLERQLKGATSTSGVNLLSGRYKQLKTELEAAKASAFGFNQAVQQQGNLAQQATAKFGRLYGAVQAVIGAAVVRQAANFTLEMARLAGNTEGVQRAFERAFPNSFAILQDLREATRGTVTDFELMQRTLQATNLGLEVQSLPQLFEFAAVRAQQTGESVDYLVDSIVRGIGRKSPLILDNLGISAIRLKDKFNGAALAAQSVADVTRAVSEIAGEELNKMGGFVETSATKVDQLNVAWTNLRVNLAKAIDSSGIINFFTEAANGMARLLKGQQEIEKEAVQQRATTEFNSLRENQLANQRLQNGKLVAQTQQQLIDATQNEIRERMKLIEAGKVELLILKERYDQHNNTGNATGKVVEDALKARQEIAAQGVGLQKNIKFYEETIKLLRNYFNELKKGNEVEGEGTGIIERKREEIKKIQEQIEKTNKLSDLGVGGKLIAKLEIAQAELADLQRAFTDFQVKEFNDEITDAAQSLTNIDEVLRDVGNKLSVTDALIPKQAAPKSFYEPDTWDLLKEDFIDKWRDITSAGIDIQAEQLHSLADMEVANMELRLRNTEEFFEHQQELAGNNERAKEVLRLREQRETKKLRDDLARKEKASKRTHVLIDMAAGIAKAFATYPWPYALIPAAFVAAQGASSLAIINRQPTGFAKGVIDLQGPGTTTSDSIPVRLSKHESVMTAVETRNAGDVLREIRAKRLDNDKLKELRQGRAAIIRQDNGELIKAIKTQKPPDVVKISNTLYDVREYSDGYKKRVRSRSMGI